MEGLALYTYISTTNRNSSFRKCTQLAVVNRCGDKC